MTVLKCKMCGGDLNFEEGATVVECEYCGTKQTVPTIDDEKKITLFARANRLRFACEFDKASGIYESIVAGFPTEAEAYWGLVLCKYGVEYVDDPATGKKIPTCHRSSFESVMEDDNFDLVMENADPIARSVYRDEAKQIEELRRGIIEVSNKEEPYDIFICYKETAENGERTIDSVIAQDVYHELTEKGYRVFFSRITLEDKLGQEYEPYIFAALNSAKIMLAFGTDYEYYNAVWVKNEWSRFLQLIAKGEKKTLIPCYKNIDAYDMPKEFTKLQAQDMGKVGAMQDLLRGIEKLLPRKESEQPGKGVGTVQQQTQSATIDSLLKRAFMYLEDRDWRNAADYCNRVLDISPENAEAYVGLLMAELQVRKEEELAGQTKSFGQNKYFIKAVHFAGEERREILEGYRKAVENYVAEQLCKERQHQEEERQRQEERQHQEERQRQEELERQKARKDKKKKIMNILGIVFVVSLGLFLLVGIMSKDLSFGERLINGNSILIFVCFEAIIAIIWCELFQGQRIEIDKILGEANTEEQKKKALARIQKEIKKNRLTALIYGLVYFVNASFLLTACFTLTCDEKDKAVWEKFPDIIAKILEASNKWILSVPEWISSVTNGLLEAIPIWVIYLAVIVIAMIAVPSIIILIVKMMIAVFTSKDGSRPQKGTLRECCKKTYKLARRTSFLDIICEGVSEMVLAIISSVLPCIILFVLLIWMLSLEGFFSVEAIGDLIANILGLIIGVVLIILVLCAAIPLTAYIPSIIALLGKMPVDESDLRMLENLWAEVEPEKKAELMRREEEELIRWQEEQKREEELSRLAEINRESSLSEKEIWGMSYEEWTKMHDDLDAVQSYIEQEHGPDFFKDV